MKKYILLFLFLFISTFIEALPSVETEFKVSMFKPESKHLKQIFDQYWPRYEFQVSTQLYKPFYIWSNIEYMENSGHSVGGNEKTELYCLPLSLGIDVRHYLAPRVHVYLGAGVRYFLTHVRNHSDFVPFKTTTHGFGSVFRTGLVFQIYERFFADFAFDYSIQQVRFNKATTENNVELRDLNLNGISLGIGVRYRF